MCSGSIQFWHECGTSVHDDAIAKALAKNGLEVFDGVIQSKTREATMRIRLRAESMTTDEVKRRV